MTVDEFGWLDWAVRYPGPSNKVYNIINSGMGIIFHSGEGSLASLLNTLNEPTRRASWMFTISENGVLYQHYPITSSCWASGNKTANTSYWSVELVGFAPTPINGLQIPTALRLINEYELVSGKIGTRKVYNEAATLYDPTLREHREVATLWIPNVGGTACPSERYAPLWSALEGDDEMAAEDLKRLSNIELYLGGKEFIEEAVAPENGFDLTLQVEGQNKAIHELEDRLKKVLIF